MGEEKCDRCEWLKKYGVPWLLIHKELNDETLAKHLDVNIEEIPIIKRKYLNR